MSDDVRSMYRFARIPEWVLYHADLNEIAVRVYGTLDRFDGRDCFPSLKAIGIKLGKSEDAVRRAIRSLEAVGAIKVQERATADGRQTSNRYLLAGEAPFDGGSKNARVASAPPPGVANSRGTDPRESATRMRAIEEREQQDRPARPAGERVGSEVPGFVEFYEAYPRRVRRAQAAKAFASAMKRAKPDAVMAGLAARSAWWVKAGTPATKIPHPATWLNADGWLDEIEPVPAVAAATLAQAAANVDARSADEVEAAIVAGNPDLAWKLVRSKARAKGEQWIDVLAAQHALGRDWDLAQHVGAKRGGRKATEGDWNEMLAMRRVVYGECQPELVSGTLTGLNL